MNAQTEEKTSNHYYIYHGKRFDNMKSCRLSIGNGVTVGEFKKLLKMGVVIKYNFL